MSSTRRSLLAILVIALASSCGDGTITGSGSSGTTDRILVRDNSFSPRTTTVAVGTTVTWDWGAPGGAHTVTFSDGPTSAILDVGTYQRTFGVAGTFNYLCTVHGAGMSGTVIIE